MTEGEMTYVVSLFGCDDQTTFFATLTDEQADAVRLIAAFSRKKGGGCRPFLEIIERSRASAYTLESAAEE